MHGDCLTVRGQQRSRCGLVRAAGLPLPPLGRSGHDGCHLAGVTHTDHLAGQRAEGAKIGVGALPGLVDQKHVGTGQVGIDVEPAGGGADLWGGVRCDRGPRCSPNG